MKIAFCLNHFLPEKVAGIEVYTFNLAKALLKAGVEVCVVTPGYDHSKEYTVYDGIQIMHYAEYDNEDHALMSARRPPAGLPRFVKLIKELDPGLLHFQELSAGRGIGINHLEISDILEKPIILTMHLSTYSCYTGNLVYKQERACDGLIRTGACTACSYQWLGVNESRGRLLGTASGLLHRLGLDLSGKGSKWRTALGFPFLIKRKKRQLETIADTCSRIIVLTDFYKKILVQNGVPEEKLFHSAQGLPGGGVERLSIAPSPLRLVFVGRISAYKGVHLLLEALAFLPAEQVRLDIYGPEAEEAYARELREKTAGMTNVAWKGSVDPGKVTDTLRAYHVLCLPSTFSEMSPLVIQEAFAAGIPVLASHVYGNAEQVTNGVNGWLFDFKDASDLRKYIQLLINEPERIEQARQQLPPTRSFTEVAEEHLALYSGILHVKTPASA